MTALGRLATRLRRGGGSKTSDDPFVRALEAALAPDRVHNDGAARHLASSDASVYRDGAAGPVCFPLSTEEVQSCIRIAAEFGRNVVPRGAGTGLAGGTVPLGAPVVIALTKMNDILDIDVENRRAWVQAGVINLDLSNAARPLGLHFAPDPSSQQVCTIGGNVANNSGGPHCLAYGVTSAHIIALEVVLSDGEIVTLGGVEAETPGLDLRGAFVGSEGLIGITTSVCVRLTPNPPAVRTLLMAYDDVSEAAATVGAVIADGILPAAIEMMDQRITQAVEEFVHAGYPMDAAAVLLIEVDGLPDGVEADAARIAELANEHGASSVRLAQDDEERALLWKGRKNAFGAIARIKPDYYLHDTVVPRSALVGVLQEIYAIADRYDLLIMNVFHAGDGNLHPLIVYDARDAGIMERVHAAGHEIITASLDAGGVLSGEHGIGVEKRDYMGLQFSDDDLDHQNRLRTAFDPFCRLNPGKVMPSGHSCADIQALRRVDAGVWG